MSLKKKYRTKIEDLIIQDNELLEVSEEQLRVVSGGLPRSICASYEAGSCTACDDVDYYRAD